MASHPATKGKTAKHSGGAKHGATHKHNPKHAPAHNRTHTTKSHTKKAGSTHKPRKFSYGLNCTLEALAASSPFYVSDDDLLNLYDATPKSNNGITIFDALDTASKYGLAGHYPFFSQTSCCLPGAIVGMSLAIGSHAAILTEYGINIWGRIYPLDRFDIEEAWLIEWL